MHPRKHTIRYLTYLFCQFILDIVVYSRFGVESFRHFGFVLIWGLLSQDKIYFKSVLHGGVPKELQYTSVVLPLEHPDSIANESRTYLRFIAIFLL